MNRRRLVVALLTSAAALTAFSACSDDAVLQAEAGPDFEVSVGEPPEFDGCESSGDIANYAWQIVQAPADMADDNGKFLREFSDDCSFVLDSTMVVADVGVWIIELTVTDDVGDTSTDQVTVTVG